MPKLDALEAIAASKLASASLFASLVPALVNAGALSSLGAREIYENALLMIETRQGREPGMQKIYEAARELIEVRLRRSSCQWRSAPQI